MNDFDGYQDIFAGITPFEGPVEKGYMVNFLGVRTDAHFRTMWGLDPATVGGSVVSTELPTISHGEGWFENVAWVEAAREARGEYVMITLGACYGTQAVGSHAALQALNPMPARLVAVEGDRESIAWIRQHFQDNGLDPAAHWILEAALSADNEPVLFPVGSPGSGAQNALSTNSQTVRMTIAEQVTALGRVDAMLYSLLLKNTTGMQIDLVPDSEHDFKAEIRYVSAVTLKDVLGPFDRVDFVEADIQQSESIVFPPAMDMLSAKVRRVHMGTHGGDVHRQMVRMFLAWGWDIVFSYAPDSQHECPLGSFRTGDGVLTAVNPRQCPNWPPEPS